MKRRTETESAVLSPRLLVPPLQPFNIQHMTVLGFIKGVLIFFSLIFGVAFLGFGVWKLWSAYMFEQHAEKREGIFKGYHTVYHEEKFENSDGFTTRTRSKESLPMFSYTDDQGRTHDVTGTEAHFLKYMKFGQIVVVLVSPDDSAPPRLGNFYSLYGKGIELCLLAGVIFVLTFYGLKGVEALMGSEGFLHRVGQSRLPAGDMFAMLVKFLLFAGVVMGVAYYWILRRQDQALITALQAKNYQEAFLLAAEGKGVDGKTPEGETALIAAIKAGRTDVARAILSCLWVSGNSHTADGISAVRLASATNDTILLAMLLKKGAMVSDIPPSVVHDLILNDDQEILRVIFEGGYDLHQVYNQLTFGDLALIHGRLAIVRLIKDRQGLFRAPAAFVALALNDFEALAAALKKVRIENQYFCEFTLEQYAEKIGREEMIEDFRSNSN